MKSKLLAGYREHSARRHNTFELAYRVTVLFPCNVLDVLGLASVQDDTRVGVGDSGPLVTFEASPI